jgi:hypothetical protein
MTGVRHRRLVAAPSPERDTVFANTGDITAKQSDAITSFRIPLRIEILFVRDETLDILTAYILKIRKRNDQKKRDKRDRRKDIQDCDLLEVNQRSDDYGHGDEPQKGGCSPIHFTYFFCHKIKTPAELRDEC